MKRAAESAVTMDGKGVVNRRTYPRRRTTFPTVYVAGSQQKPGFGLDVGGGGICLLTREPIPRESLASLPLLAIFGNRRVPFEARGRWIAPINVRGKPHFRYGLRLSRIADHDWDFVMDHSLKENQEGLTPGMLLTGSQRDAILPPAKQHRIASILAQRKRLAYKDDGRLPLVEYSFTGCSMQRGIPFYRVDVRSRFGTTGAGPREYHSQILIAIEGDTVKFLE